MLERDGLTTLMQIVKTPEIFYSPNHKTIFKCICSLFHAGEPVDILTVSQAVRKLGELEKMGGAMFIANLTERVNSASNIEMHIRILYEMYLKREKIKLCMLSVQSGFDEKSDVFDELDSLQLQLDKLRNSFVTNALISGKQLAEKTHNAIKSAMANPGKTGVQTPIKALDSVTGGFQSPDLVIIAGRPGSGKSGLIVSFIMQCTKDQTPVGLFSLEMSAMQIQNRIFSASAVEFGERIRNSQLTKGMLSTDQMDIISHITKNTTDEFLIVDDTAGIHINELRSKAITMKQKHGIKMLIVDYLQLIKADGAASGNREQEIGFISRSLKQLAKELNIPVIALSQLSRDVEKRMDKRPQLSDLRESGSIEQDADIVMFIFRPSYYGKTRADGDEYPGLMEGESTDNYALSIIAKHRNGAVTDVPYFYNPETNTIKDWGNLHEPIQVSNNKREVRIIDFNGLEDFEASDIF